MFGKPNSVRSAVFAGVLLASLNFFSLAQDAPKRGRKYKAPPPVAHVEVTVVRASNGKPVDNASVIFHPLDDSGKVAGNMELKTNDDGKTVLDLLEVGTTVRLQIIAPGFQTYGDDYKISKENVAIDVKLKRPQEQYSIYKNHDGEAVPDNKAKPDDGDKPKDAPKDAPKPQGTGS